MSEHPDLPYEGGCRCGQVRIKVSTPPILAAACHCKGCQRMTGSAYSITVTIPSDGFAVTQGEPVMGGMHGDVHHHHCPHCLSWVFTTAEFFQGVVNLRATMLDDPTWFVPFIETYTSEMLPWAGTPAQHSYEKFPDFADFPKLIKEYAAEHERKPNG
ncbi:MAG: GFA family protein [Rhodobacteraceae bacterium]|nr:GFA family protein [Paracoccaceae bacterium]